MKFRITVLDKYGKTVFLHEWEADYYLPEQGGFKVEVLP